MQPLRSSSPFLSELLHGGLLVLAVGAFGPAQAQDRIYRCGNEYTNNAEVARERGCRLVEGGNVTVVQGTKPQAGVAPSTPAASAPGSRPPAAPTTRPPATASPEQRARDSDARQILEGELRRAQDRLAQARQAYANGQPDKEGIEFRNHQRYLDRVAELKAAVDRAESDIAGLQRELARLGPVASPR